MSIYIGQRRKWDRVKEERPSKAVFSCSQSSDTDGTVPGTVRVTIVFCFPFLCLVSLLRIENQKKQIANLRTTQVAVGSAALISSFATLILSTAQSTCRCTVVVGSGRSVKF